MRRVPWVRIGISAVLGIVLTLGMAWVVPNVMPENSFSDSGFILVDGTRVVGGRFQEVWYKSDLVLAWYSEADLLEARQQQSGSPGSFRWDPEVRTSIPWWVPEPHGSTADAPVIWTVAMGVPLRCLKTERNLSEYPYRDGLRFTVPSWLAKDEEWSIATVPIWRGLLANSLFWSVVVAVPFFAPGHVTRYLRRKRGWCVGCGYDLASVKGLACPECGAEHRKSKLKLATGS